MRRTSVCLLALAVLFILWGGGTAAHGDELLRVETDINYAVNTDAPSVSVTWDISLENNDPATQFGGGQVFFYEGLTLPVLSGASLISATTSDGIPLAVTRTEGDVEFIDRVEVFFDHNLFFGDTYDFTLSYTLPESRNETLLVTSAYFYIPLITLGDTSSVTVSAPTDAPWQTDLTEQDCVSDLQALQCSGSETSYVAGLLEVSRPDLVATTEFEAPLAANGVAVSLTYFQGEEAIADHQRQVIQAALPLIEETYGFAPSLLTPDFDVIHSGRQAVFGYEGLTSCTIECQIAISPVASDQTLIHELAHLWSDRYKTRWLSEGFAEWVAREVMARLPGLVGQVLPYEPTATSLQLDEWGDVESLIGADEEYVATTQAGYDLSLRFIETLAEEVGSDGLRAVNRRIVELGQTTDSRDYMDVLEEVTGINPDRLFLLWVFPESYEPLVEQRRTAWDRYAEVSAALAAGGFPDDGLAAVLQSMNVWQFDEAMSTLNEIELNLGRYEALTTELDELLSDADVLGLVVPDSLESAIERWEFEAAEDLLDSARQALGAFGRAQERVEEPRSLWQKFGLIGDDPDAELEAAQESFENGSFNRSLERSEAAIEMIDGAGGAAARRMFAVAAILGVFVLGLAVAYWLAVSRQRRFGEEG